MDWEAFKKHKAFAGEKKPSMLRRRVGHDYEQRCVYLVTMTVEGRRPLLGRLVGDARAESGSSDAPHVELSPLGKQVREMWEAISEHYPEVRVLATMVMPDPTHGFLFSRNYNDHILEGEGELERWFRYLVDNPRRLAVKRQHPEFFTIVRDVRIGEWACQTVGNQYLLSYPEKAAVIVHSAYSDEEFKKLKAQWLALAARGGVLISAAVATREKEVMREAMNSGYRLIALRENGFSPLYKPAGESFAACSQGTLLQVSPWEYHMNRRTISREQCLQLNRIAEWIVEH